MKHYNTKAMEKYFVKIVPTVKTYYFEPGHTLFYVTEHNMSKYPEVAAVFEVVPYENNKNKVVLQPINVFASVVTSMKVYKDDIEIELNKVVRDNVTSDFADINDAIAYANEVNAQLYPISKFKKFIKKIFKWW